MMRAALVLVPALSLAAALAAQTPQAPRETWNEIYGKQGAGTFQPNEFLVRMTKPRTPGAALDIGTGEGRNALYLASQGWTVTAFDVSDVGVALLEQEAKRKGLPVTAVVADVDKFDYGHARWDLIAGMYMHDMVTRNAARIVESLKPGGLLVVEGFHRDFRQRGASGEYYGHGTNELLRAFDGLRVVYYEEATATPYWLKEPKPAPIVRMAAVRERDTRY